MPPLIESLARVLSFVRPGAWLLVCVASSLGSRAEAQSLSIGTELTASDAAGLDQMGWSVALNGPGTRAVLGAVGDDDGGSGSGSAYVYVKNGANWVFEAKLVALDAGANDFFGESVAIDQAGDRIAVGAIFEDAAGFNAGAVYVFRRNGSSWVQEIKLIASDALASDSFGKAVAMDWAGLRVVVGVEDKDVNGGSSGAAYVFLRSGVAWSQEQRIVPLDNQSGDGFGTSVAIDSQGARVAIGAADDDDSAFNAGSVYVFSRSGTVWSEEDKLLPALAQPSDFFGEEVSISTLGDVVAVGAQGADDNGQNSGVAFVFDRTGTSWTEVARLVASDGAPNDFFGGDLVIDGAGRRVMVGARGHDSAGVDVGAVYFWAKGGAGWQFVAKRTPSVSTPGDAFGKAVYLNSTGTVGLVGASGSDAAAVDGGAGWVLASDDIFVPGEIATIQGALDAAFPGDTIQVAPGTYFGSIDFGGRDVAVVSTGGLEATILQGTGGSVVTLDSGEGPGAVLDGFTITGGDGDFGAGIRIAGADPVIRNCMLTGNSNASRGGALEVDQGGAGLIEDCTFSGNASGLGGALSVGPSSTPLFRRCIVFGNTAANGGGALLCGTSAAPQFENCSFEENSTPGPGGAVYQAGASTAVFVSSLFARNSANEGGSVYALTSSTPTFDNVTMTGNTAVGVGGGLTSVNSLAAVRNSVVWGNTDVTGTAAGAQLTELAGVGLTVNTSIVEGGHAGGTAVIDADPVFADTPGGDYRLTFGSPAIDAGANALVPGGFAFDLAGLARFLDDPTTPDTGVGTSPIVDLGAYEAPDPCGPLWTEVVFCTGKLNSAGCVPVISSTGRASATDPNPFTISSTMDLNFKNGILFYGFNGRAAIPFLGATLCVAPPLRRTPSQNSGGNPPPAFDCSGSFTFDFNAWFQGGSDPIVAVGQVLRAQYWSRDPAISDGTGSALSNALEFYVCP